MVTIEVIQENVLAGEVLYTVQVYEDKELIDFQSTWSRKDIERISRELEKRYRR